MKRLLFIAVLVFFTVSVSFAQTFSIGPNVGYAKAKDADNGNFLFGGAARFNFLMFGVEGTIHYGEQKFFNDVVKVQQYPISVSGMFYPIPFLYACAGFDWFNYKTTVNIPGVAETTSSEIGYHFGAGVQLSLGSVYLTGDARYVLQGKMKVPSSGEIDNSLLVLSVGLLFKL